jgi:hypothetical protein
MRRALLCSLAFLLIALCWPGSDAGTRYARTRPEPTTAGRFEGTWVFYSVKQRFAFFVREEEGAYELKVRWLSQGAETFETDFTGRAAYTFRGFPAEVSFDVDQEASNENVIEGDYLRQLFLEEGDYRKEWGRFRLERAIEGRTLVWSFLKYEQEYRTLDKIEAGSKDDIFYLLRKVSHRVVDWEEIPW